MSRRVFIDIVACWRQVEGFTPLHIAAWNGHEDVLDMLLGQPAANIFAVTKRLLTVQDLAARKGHTAVTRLLLEFLDELPLVSEPIRGLLSPSRQEQVRLRRWFPRQLCGLTTTPHDDAVAGQ